MSKEDKPFDQPKQEEDGDKHEMAVAPTDSTDVSWLLHDLRAELNAAMLHNAMLHRDFANDEEVKRNTITIQEAITQAVRLIEVEVPVTLIKGLQPILTKLQELSRAVMKHIPGNPIVEKRCTTLQKSVDRMRELINATIHRPAPELLSLNVLARDMQTALLVICEEKKITFDVTLANDLRQTWCVRAEIVAVLRNICMNAIEAMPNGGELTIKTRNIENAAYVLKQEKCLPTMEPNILMTITDTGVGMNEHLQLLVFTPHISTKGEGRGMGLHLIEQLLRRNAVHIQLGSAPGRGTRIELLFCRKRTS